MQAESGQLQGWLSPALERRRIAACRRLVPPGASVLDVGCGRAELLDAIAPSAYVGIDVLENVIAANRVRRADALFLCIDVEREPLPLDRRFDAIVMLAILEHLSSPQELLGKLTGALADGGRIVLTTPHPSAERVHRIGARLGLFSKGAAEEHKHFFDGAALGALARGCGLRLTHYRRFQAGMNQVAVMERQH